MKKIRTVLAGLGRIGWVFHLPALRQHPGFELVAVADPVADRLEEASALMPGLKCYSNVSEMIRHEKPELTVLASPTVFHCSQVMEAFAVGSDVFVEKPLAVDVAETENIIAEMEKSSRKLMVYHPRRLDADCRQARELLRSGILGNVHLIRRNVRNYNRRNDWQSMKRYAGGMLNNYGVHYLDQVCYTAGFDFECEYCDLRRVNSTGDAEDCFKVIMRNRADLVAEVEVSQSCAFPANEWLLEGNLGTAYYSSATKQWQIRYIAPDQLKTLTVQTTLAADNRLYPHEKIVWNEQFEFRDAPDQEFYDNLYAYLDGSGEPLVKISETRKVMHLLADARKLDERNHAG